MQAALSARRQNRRHSARESGGKLAPDSGLDVFVSYAHADNGVPLGASVQHGWVTALASNLNEGPNVFKKRFFIDHQLRPGDDFSSELLNKVERSSLLVLLLSQNYIDSQWCGRELEHFIRAHSANPEKPSDVYVVELFPYESLINVPLNIRAGSREKSGPRVDRLRTPTVWIA
jgi:hypothetical protein